MELHIRDEAGNVCIESLSISVEEKGQGDLPDWVQALVMIVVFALVVMSGLK